MARRPRNASSDMQLETDAGGGPFVPATAGVDGAAPADAQGPDVGAGFIVEVELKSGSAVLGSHFAAQAAAMGSGAPTAPSASGLEEVLGRFGVVHGETVHSVEEDAAERAHLDRRQRDAAIGAASPDQVSALGQLPPKSAYVRFEFPAGASREAVMTALEATPEVDKVVVVSGATPPLEPVAAAPPSDPLVGAGDLGPDPQSGLEQQWYLHRTRAPLAWRFSRGSGVVIADVDWGYRTSHQDIASGIELTYNAVDGGAVVTQGPQIGHGTAVLGIAGARADGVGIAGYAPEAALWAIQGDSAPTPPKFHEPWAEAIDFVRRQPSDGRRKVIILEVQTGIGGNYEQIPSVHRAVRAAIADGCVVCVAAGNGNRPADQTDQGRSFDPTGSILVGATGYDLDLNRRAWFSNFGSRVVVCAPGDMAHDVTCGPGSDKAYRNGFGGTSGATPKVAGTVALMLSVNPALSHSEVREILRGTGAAPSEDPGKPIGVFLNTEAAVAEAARRRADALPTAPTSDTETRPQNLQGVHRRPSSKALPGDPMPPPPPDEATAAAADNPQGELPPEGDQTLARFRSSVEGVLTQKDRVLIVSQAIQLLDNFYVHRPLKEAIHAVRPIQRLRVLHRRLQQYTTIPEDQRDELSFHNTVTQVFNTVRDLHTNYQLPQPFRDYIAYLPFEIAPFWEDGRRRYLVTRVVRGYPFQNKDFGPGAEIVYWNGMSIERAVQANADQTAGSNDAARHARGVSSVTLRPMNTVLPPSADYVDMEFVPKDRPADSVATMRQHWFVRYAPATGGGAAVAQAQIAQPAPAPTPSSPGEMSLDLTQDTISRSSDLLFAGPAAAGPPSSSTLSTPARPDRPGARDLALSATLGLDSAADAVREARQLLFEPDQLSLTAPPSGRSFKGTASPGTVEDLLDAVELPVNEPWNAAFRARTVQVAGREYGHITIRTFYVNDPDGFVQEFVRLIEQMPPEGLIVDVRGNGGGNILASERLLQTLTARRIEPERMLFVATPGTADLCRSENARRYNIDLGVWRPSLEEAVETGAVYSNAFPITDPESCNSIGQRYYGPVVLLVDGNCYSATDIFAAGFQDHDIGRILGVSNNTGAGGANVWEHWLLDEVMPTGWGLEALPNRAGLRVAIRQCLRVGPRAGSLLEDFGVVPDDVHRPTRKDVTKGDVDLLERAAGLLATQMVRSIRIQADLPHAGRVNLHVETEGIDVLDLYVNDRPKGSIELGPGPDGRARQDFVALVGTTVKCVGWQAGVAQPCAVRLYRVS